MNCTFSGFLSLVVECILLETTSEGISGFNNVLQIFALVFAVINYCVQASVRTAADELSRQRY